MFVSGLSVMWIIQLSSKAVFCYLTSLLSLSTTTTTTTIIIKANKKKFGTKFVFWAPTTSLNDEDVTERTLSDLIQDRHKIIYPSSLRLTPKSISIIHEIKSKKFLTSRHDSRKWGKFSMFLLSICYIIYFFFVPIHVWVFNITIFWYICFWCYRIRYNQVLTCFINNL